MLEYDPHYPTILPLGLTLVLVLALNILIPVAAIFLARRSNQRKRRLLAFASLWLLFSPVIMVIMATPTKPSDDELGPAVVMLALPILMEVLMLFFVYAITLLFLYPGRLRRQSGSAPPSPS